MMTRMMKEQVMMMLTMPVVVVVCWQLLFSAEADPGGDLWNCRSGKPRR